MSIIRPLKPLGRTFGFVLFFVFFLGLSAPSQADEKKPQSKWGLGLGAGWISDYPGAAQGRMRFLPFPVYRGSAFRIDRISGVSGDVFANTRFDFSWNFIFQFPTDSESIPVRQGMPDLDWLLSLGPQMKYFIYVHPNHTFFFRFPIRLNACTNFAKRSRFCGVVFNPGFRHAIRYQGLGELTFRAEALIQSSEYQQYFFEVPKEFATPTRPSFHARAGFLGFVYGFFHTLPFEGWNLSSSVNIYDYSLAINHNSPLFIHKTNYGFLMAVTFDI